MFVMNYIGGGFVGGGVGSSVFGLQGRVQVLQAQLFPVCPGTGQGFLSSFLSKGLKTNQLEVNTDEKTLRPIARLKEPRDLFALPKDKDHDCSQQAARFPTECQVLEERIHHIPYIPPIPEPYNQPTGNELKPRPVGEENGIVVFNYNPVSAVNYSQNKKCDDSDASDTDISSSESRGSSPDRRQKLLKHRFSKMFSNYRSSSNSNDENDDNDDNYDDDDEEEDEEIAKLTGYRKKTSAPPVKVGKKSEPDKIDADDNIEDIWGNNSPYYSASPTKCLIQRIEAKPVPKEASLPEMPTAQSARLEIFSRSSVGGSKFLTQVHPFSREEYNGLWFESRFESGNLAKAVKITETYYELYLRPDLYTSRSKQWFYFRVSRTRKDLIYRFSIVNLVKSDSLYNEGMRPLMYSTIGAIVYAQGWKRCGENICYYRNDDESTNEEDEDNWSYTLTFNIEFPHDEDTVYFAHSYPYTYTDLQDYLMAIQKHPVKSKFCKLRLLCRSLAGNNVYYLTVTAPTTDEENMKKKKAIVVSARVHPSETPSSWMMKGLMDFITGDSSVAKRLRHKFIFKLIPMLNPDGVIVGNTRNSLTGKDLNRQYRTVIRETYPSIWYTKAMIKRLIDECGVAMYCDMHAHSRRQNIFVYGCENRRNPEKKLTEQVFPLMMHKNVADKFSFENCKFKIQRSKEGTGRIVVWMLGVTNSYTIEASFGGSSLGSRKGTHFSTGDYEQMGRAFCETLLDYCDENPNKERLRLKIIERLLKEGSSADEPLNIPLSDYSSDEGDTSSSSDNEGKADRFSDLEGPCCKPIKAPPCSPEFNAQKRKLRRRKRSKSFSVIRYRRGNRTTLDMPTTDPGSDLLFSTDDEMFADGDAAGVLNTVPRSRRYLLKSDLQRRYIDTIGDKVVLRSRRMPPELIVTPAKQGNSNTNRTVLMKSPERQQRQFLSSGIPEFPRSSGILSTRTSSWQNLHLGRKNTNSSTAYNVSATEPSSNEMQFSLKKKIWSGCLPEPSSSSSDRPRPLSWSLSQNSRHKHDEQEAFFTACSQKLMAWQQETVSYSHRKKTTVKFVNHSFLVDKPSTAKLIKPAKSSTRSIVEPQREKTVKLTTTSRIISCLTKSDSSTSVSTKKNAASLPYARHVSASLAPLLHSTRHHHGTNKFKTTGLVAAAVQPSKKSRRHQRTVLTTHKSAIVPPVESNQSLIDSEKTIVVRKVKTKLKKKKSTSSIKGLKS